MSAARRKEKRMSVLNGLEPKSVFKFFEDISAIPRGSGNTKAVSDYLAEFARVWRMAVRMRASSSLVPNGFSM